MAWSDKEDSQEALLEVAAIPESVMVLKGLGQDHNQILVQRLLDINISDPAKDREMVIAKAQLDGARNMLRYLIQQIEEAARPKNHKK